MTGAPKVVARRLLGTRYDDATTLLAEAAHRARWLRSPLRRVTRAYVSGYGLTVRRGPFAGLRYGMSDVRDVTTMVPKLMGSYEQEIHGALDALIASRPDLVVNAGCADGYYAVGLARRLPEVTVHAFDLDPRWRAICRRLAEANAVADRIELAERLDADTLARLPLSNALVVIDCDGCEGSLFDHVGIAALARAAVVIETHDTIVPGVTDALLERFGGSHDAEVIDAQPRWISDFPDIERLADLDYVERELAITEFRPQQRWLVLRPRSD